MSTMGFNNQLFPEEAIFLVDRDEIELIDENNNKFTKESAFALLDQCNIDMKLYSAYATLREQRFPTYRHGAWKKSASIASLLAPTLITTRRSQSSLPSSSSSSSSSSNIKRVKVELNNNNNNNNIEEENQKQEEDDELRVCFDVYQPQSGFSKTKMDKPSFFITIIGADDDLPPLIKIKALLAKCKAESVPLRLCIVGDSSITFVEIDDFDPCENELKRAADFKNTIM